MSCNHPLRLRKRAEFLAVKSGEKSKGPFFLIEFRQQNSDEPRPKMLPARIGFTVTRKNGNAVVRNRIKRRLREVVRIGIDHKHLTAGLDYVIIAKRECLTIPFKDLIAELNKRLNKIKMNVHTFTSKEH